MNEVYILIIVNEVPEDNPEVLVSAYQDMERALKAYSVSVDEARAEAEEYGCSNECKEICTESYRWYRIEDMLGSNAITIILEAKEIIESESDDI